MQKTQDKALDQWGSTYRNTSRELDTLRDENCLLRTQLRQHAKQMEAYKGGPPLSGGLFAP